MPQPVSDVASNAQENIAHAATIIGHSTHRSAVFDAIYTGKVRIKSVSELMKLTKLERKRVLDAGKKLADNKIVSSCNENGERAYEKIDFYHAHKRKILQLAKYPERLSKYPTKRNPITSTSIVNLKISRKRARVRQITIDDIRSFNRAWEIKADKMIEDQLSETAFKIGLKKIIGEIGEFKDWGGETEDIYTTRMLFGNKRRPAAFALKGPATRGKLTPGKMGKNGDQIQRLFEAPADLYLVQYCRQIDQSVIKLMDSLAVTKSVLTGREILYGVIDGTDSYRLMRAYSRHLRRSRVNKG
jgi:hypothetical protein